MANGTTIAPARDTDRLTYYSSGHVPRSFIESDKEGRSPDVAASANLVRAAMAGFGTDMQVMHKEIEGRPLTDMVRLNRFFGLQIAGGEAREIDVLALRKETSGEFKMQLSGRSLNHRLEYAARADTLCADLYLAMTAPALNESAAKRRTETVKQVLQSARSERELGEVFNTFYAGLPGAKPLEQFLSEQRKAPEVRKAWDLAVRRNVTPAD